MEVLFRKRDCDIHGLTHKLWKLSSLKKNAIDLSDYQSLSEFVQSYCLSNESLKSLFIAHHASKTYTPDNNTYKLLLQSILRPSRSGRTMFSRTKEKLFEKIAEIYLEDADYHILEKDFSRAYDILVPSLVKLHYLHFNRSKNILSSLVDIHKLFISRIKRLLESEMSPEFKLSLLKELKNILGLSYFQFLDHPNELSVYLQYSHRKEIIEYAHNFVVQDSGKKEDWKMFLQEILITPIINLEGYNEIFSAIGSKIEHYQLHIIGLEFILSEHFISELAPEIIENYISSFSNGYRKVLLRYIGANHDKFSHLKSYDRKLFLEALWLVIGSFKVSDLGQINLEDGIAEAIIEKSHNNMNWMQYLIHLRSHLYANKKVNFNEVVDKINWEAVLLLINEMNQLEASNFIKLFLVNFQNTHIGPIKEEKLQGFYQSLLKRGHPELVKEIKNHILNIEVS